MLGLAVRFGCKVGMLGLAVRFGCKVGMLGLAVRLGYSMFHSLLLCFFCYLNMCLCVSNTTEEHKYRDAHLVS